MNRADVNPTTPAGSSKVFVLDANVFIQAHRRYYSFDICPGFWQGLLHYGLNGQVLSIDKVRQELLAGDNDALASWIRYAVPESFFVSTQNPEVAWHFAEIMDWVQANDQFKPEAKTEFAAIADGWLVAAAATHGYTVVTLEEYNPETRRKVPIPNLCQQFGVNWANTYAMLRALNLRFDWNAENIFTHATSA